MTNRKGRITYTPEEDAERKNFFLQRLRNGFSRLEAQKQFAQEFGCTIDTARTWYNNTTAELVSPDLQDRRRTHAVIVEMYHTQITSMQADLIAVQNEILIIDKINKRRDELVDEIIDETHEDRGECRKAKLAEKQLSLLPEVRIDTKLNGLEIKSRARERMFRVISELARLQGVQETDNNWVGALHTLLDNGLLPPSNAQHILGVIDNLNQQVQSPAYPVEAIEESIEETT